MIIDLQSILPQIILSIGGLCLLLLSTLPSAKKISNLSCAITLAIFLASLASLFITTHHGTRHAFSNNIAVDGLGTFFSALCIISAIFTFLLSIKYIQDGGWGIIEYGAILIFATAGMVFMVSSENLITIYIGLELMAISSYVLASFSRDKEKSFESGFKYFILGSFSSGILLYGISLIYGATGTVDLVILLQALQLEDKLLTAGIILTLCGLLFKIAAVPFHIWTPDVYEGAPTPVTSFFSTGPKAAGFAVIIRIMALGLAPMQDVWIPLLALSAGCTMIFGNLVALMQKNIKRMLAFSSIAHAGYILLGVLAHNKLGYQAILYYLIAYVLMNAGAFALVVYLKSNQFACETIDDFRGLHKKNPLAAFCMLIFMLSLTGIPPTAGFVGKFFLFAAAIQSGYITLAIIGFMTSVVSLYYYMGPVKAMYMSDDTSEGILHPHWAITLTLIICLAGTLVIGIIPNRIINIINGVFLTLS
ncbi:MAG: NADH-quinone oxidoreductase subunit N [Chlamydiota bacterium]|nr:NADH-quinone oxidoreductase subunit N [Chlamydiota bacterium]